jgi:dTDP-glucose pyrophosphorylase
MKDALKMLIVPPTMTLYDSLCRLDAGGVGSLFVVDDSDVLVGVVTDGDIRRGLLRGVTMSSRVSQVMNPNYAFWHCDQPIEAAVSFLKSISRRQLPIVTADRKLIDVILLDQVDFVQKPNPVVMMAGGLGTRMRPLTNSLPKPMLKIGGKPILENLLERVIQQGFRNFYFCVNFCADQIQEHFGNGDRWNISIAYLREEQRLGTAGGMALLKSHLRGDELPIVVMNGDLITSADISSLLVHHEVQKSDATMCVCQYKYQVPYGVVNTKDMHIVGLEEKPVHEYIVNAGIYAINPVCLELIPPGTYFDMTQLFEALLKNKMRTAVYPLQDYWLDVGRPEDYEQARQLFSASASETE